MKTRRIYQFALLGLLALMAAPVAIAGGRSLPRQLDPVRSATARYQDVKAAGPAGYAQFLGCMQQPGQGAMGLHFVNNALVGDALLDPLHPEALLYEPKDGKMRLTGVEYVVMVDAWRAAGHTSPPALFGQTFIFTDSPNMFGLPPFYSLHAWIWKANPAGLFVPWNPAISCPN